MNNQKLFDQFENLELRYLRPEGASMKFGEVREKVRKKVQKKVRTLESELCDYLLTNLNFNPKRGAPHHEAALDQKG